MNRSVYAVLVLLLLSGCFEAGTPATPAATNDYAAIARGKVVVEGGLVAVSAPLGTLVSEVLVQASSKVNQDEILARLDPRSAKMALAEAKALQQQAKAQLAALRGRLAAAEQLAQRSKKAAAAGVLEKQQAEEAAEALKQLRAEIAIAQSGVGVADVRQRQAEQGIELLSLRAPLAADVVKVQVNPGVMTTEPVLFLLLPQRPLQVRAEVNESFLGKIRVDGKAQVMLESQPQAAALGGRVVRVGRMLEPGVSGAELQPAHVVEVIVAFEQPQPLLVGQSVMVKFYE